MAANDITGEPRATRAGALSRGLAKSGGSDPYDAGGDDRLNR